MRRPLIAANWKMHTDRAGAVALARAVAGGHTTDDREVMVAPPFVWLEAVAAALAGSTVALGAQNVAWEAKGAFTGEISPVMLSELGCRYVIVGHSERRHIFGEDDAMINRRLAGGVAHGLTPILCVGETLAEREAGHTLAVLERQVRKGLADTTPETDLVIAYEPVWAIGTGRTATTDQAQEAHRFIRGLLAEIHGQGQAARTRILYGGSVKPDNVDGLMAQEDIDGALVGGAGLKADSFLRIVHFQ